MPNGLFRDVNVLEPKGGCPLALKLLVSVISPDEAQSVADLGVDILDIKNPNEGSLGAQPPWVIGRIAQSLADSPVSLSATLGDLPYHPGTAALAASGAARFALTYLKAGIRGVVQFHEAHALITAVRQGAKMVNPKIQLIAAGYADYRKFGGLPPKQLVDAAAEAGAHGVMLDTAIKDGSDLFDSIKESELAQFVQAGRGANLKVALAGSLSLKHLPVLRRLGPDIVGIRGAVCSQADRSKRIDPTRAREFVAAFRNDA